MGVAGVRERRAPGSRLPEFVLLEGEGSLVGGRRPGDWAALGTEIRSGLGKKEPEARL